MILPRDSPAIMRMICSACSVQLFRFFSSGIVSCIPFLPVPADALFFIFGYRRVDSCPDLFPGQVTCPVGNSRQKKDQGTDSLKEKESLIVAVADKIDKGYDTDPYDGTEDVHRVHSDGLRIVDQRISDIASRSVALHP